MEVPVSPGADRACTLQLSDRDWYSGSGVGNNDLTNPQLEVTVSGTQAEHSHQLGCCRNDESGLVGRLSLAEADNDFS